MKSVTIMIATTGRSSLWATVKSFASDVRRGDVVHLAVDGFDNRVRSLAQGMRHRYDGEWICSEREQLGCWGHSVRNELLPSVTTDLVWHLDDDDVAAPDALDAIRNSGDPWTMFRMEFMSGHPAHGVVCWRNKIVRHGDIGTPMSVAPPSNARFGLEYGGDFLYAEGLLKEFGEPIWDETIVALIRPHETL